MRSASAATAVGRESLEWFRDDHRPLDWNGPVGRVFTKFDAEDLNAPLIERLERIARQRKDHIAVSDSDTALTYTDLWGGLSGLAEIIAERTRPGELVGVLAPASPLFPLAILACLAAGRPFVALDPRYPRDWLRQAIEDTRPTLILSRQDVCEVAGIDVADDRVIDLERGPRRARHGWRPAPFDVDGPACVLFTSGSSGRPKGVVNSQRALLQRAAQSINAAHINADDRFLTLASLCTIVGVRDAITALLSGAHLRILDPQTAGARDILDVIRAESVTILFAFPSLLRSLLASSPARASESLRLVRIGGDTILWRDIDRLRAWLSPEAAIQSIYAATEAPMMQWFVDESCRGDDPRVPIGYPLPGNSLALVDEYGHTPRPGDVGELIVSGPYVALGTWNERRCGSEFGASSHRFFRTGDLARLRPDGLIERIGRKDRQVKIRGARVELEGVEAALRAHPHVRDAGALVRTHDADGDAMLVAYVSAHKEPPGLIGALRDMMRAAPSPMRPARFYLVPEIPLLPSSKLDVSALAALDRVNARQETEEAAAFDASVIEPNDAVVRAAAQVWLRVLHAPVRGCQDDFFEAGGDSLKAIDFALELERALGCELPVTLIHEAPVFADLCEALRDRARRAYVPLVVLKPGDASPPVFLIHGAGGAVVDLFPIARRMTYAGPVIGIQARGLTGKDAPHATVEAMAGEYLAAIKTRQPHGPYYLCGYSFGGLTAFEIARRLRQSGEEIGLLALFDTRISLLARPLQTSLAAIHRTVRLLARAITAPIRFQRTRNWAQRHADETQAALRLPFLKAAPARVLKVAASALIASAKYRPGFYPGQLTLFEPIERDPDRPALCTVWRVHAQSLTVIETGGSHATMLSASNAEVAAETLTRLLSASLEHAPSHAHASNLDASLV